MNAAKSRDECAQRLLRDFLEQDDLHRLARDAGLLLGCPLLVIDDTFRVAAHYMPEGFSDAVFEGAVTHGAITYEAGALISASPLLSAGSPDTVRLEDSPYPRRFAPLISGGLRLGYLICVDRSDSLGEIAPETYRTVEAVLAKQLFMEASRQDKPFGTAEEILIHLLDGGFSAASFFYLQCAATYLADFHPTAFALIDLTGYHSGYLGKNQLRDELTYRFYDSHPFLYRGDIVLFLHKGDDLTAFFALAAEFRLKVVISQPIGELYDLPSRYAPAREALDLMAGGGLEGSVYSVDTLSTLLMLTRLQKQGPVLPQKLRALAESDRTKGSRYCETLYYYLITGGSLKQTCAVLYSHRNTVLYRIRKLREHFGISLEDPTNHLPLLLPVSLILLEQEGPGFFLKQTDLRPPDGPSL